MTRLNVGCGNHYARGWVNVDRVYTDSIRPDIVNPTGHPALIEVEDVEAIYLGHVLEHVRWEDVTMFLVQCRDLLNPGGQICVVGPDVWNTLRMWKAGQVGDDLLTAVLEGPHPQIDGVDAHHDGARHQWNATQDRVVQKLTAAGFVNINPYRSVQDVESHWPVVARPGWQSAVSAVKA